MKRLSGAVVIILIVLVIGLVLLGYSQGKRIDRNGKISDSGILEIDTTPNEAKIYLDGKFNSNSDQNIENLKPGQYTVRLEKDHFTTWEKMITIKKGSITPLKVTLFPTNPSLVAITFDGIYSPKLSTDNKKVVFGIQNSEKAGLWTLDLSDPQIFFDNRLKKIVADSNLTQFSKSNFFWTSDGKKILVEVQSTGSTATAYFLIDPTKLTSNPENLANDGLSQKEKIIADNLKINQDKLKKLGNKALDLAKEATSLVFSKDNSAVIINQALVFDSKPSPVPGTESLITNLEAGRRYFFLQDDQNHIVAIENNVLSVMDRDGSNKVDLFTGDFDQTSVFSWPDGKRIVISINLNSKQNPLPNLYTISLD